MYESEFKLFTDEENVLQHEYLNILILVHIESTTDPRASKDYYMSISILIRLHVYWNNCTQLKPIGTPEIDKPLYIYGILRLTFSQYEYYIHEIWHKFSRFSWVTWSYAYFVFGCHCERSRMIKSGLIADIKSAVVNAKSLISLLAILKNVWMGILVGFLFFALPSILFSIFFFRFSFACSFFWINKQIELWPTEYKRERKWKKWRILKRERKRELWSNKESYIITYIRLIFLTGQSPRSE